MKPYVKYDEGFIDEGDVNMLAVMRELLKVKYTREFYPEHPRALDNDRDSKSIPAGAYPEAADTPAMSTISPMRRQCCKRP